MSFERIHEGELGAPVRDVVQEAVDATVTRYARTPDVDVEQSLREQLHGRGVRATEDRVIEEIGARIRAGREVRIGDHDGSIA
jgi:hypothetical protein